MHSSEQQPQALGAIPLPAPSPSKKILAGAANVLIVLLTTIFCLAAGELIFRVVDGDRLASVTLVRTQELDPRTGQQFVQSLSDRGRRYAVDIKIDPTFQLKWYDADPPAATGPKGTFSLPADWEKALKEAKGWHQIELHHWFNYNFVKKVCETKVKYPLLQSLREDPGFIYTFAGPDDTEYPIFRFVPEALNYNNFGYRGSDISFPKPAQTVRIAFLGYSTTENGWPWTYPDFVAQFLRDWARSNGLNVDFDVVNAGRSGVGSDSIVSILRYEVAPLHPDIVILNSGAATAQREHFLVPDDDAAASRSWQAALSALKQYSALAVRLAGLIARMQGNSEPPKPPHRLRFDFSQKVDLESADLPFFLHQQIKNIREMARLSRGIGAEFFLASSLVMVRDGMRVDPDRYLVLYERLNGYYWPITYAELRAGIDFENRVYRALSESDHLGFIDIDKYFPWDPEFFYDQVHFYYQPGFRLQGWIIAQQLAPLIREKLREGGFPRQGTAEPEAISWARQTPKRFDLGCLP